MKTDAQSLLLLLGGAGFVAYLALKMLVGLSHRGGVRRESQQDLLAAKRRAGDRSSTAVQRAAAFRDAARIALDELQRPGLAASFARRAERLDPSDPDAVGLLAIALRKAARYSALERLLWRQLADEPNSSAPSYARAFEELVALYEGPLRRPDTARVLRRFKSRHASG